MLVVDLGKWMNKILIDWGIDAKVADRFDETIIAILMIAIAVGVDYLCQAILVGGMRQYTRRKPHLWNTLLMKRKVFHNLIHTIPAILVYALLPMAFMRGKELLVISQKACAIYIIFSLLLAINGILLMIMDIYDGKETMKNRPMKGFIQVLQVLLFFIGGIVIISILVNKSPASLFAGLGAGSVAAVLAYHIFSHVKNRVTIWLDPWSTIDTTGYQICQSLFAIGMGSWFGYGLGQGMPDKIPVAEKDFMFSALTEEFGIIFTVALLLICLNNLILMMNIASRCKTLFYRLVAVGLGVTYGFQVFLTVGGAIKMIPMTGVTLPFVSYGGSSIISSLVMFALINGMYNMRQDEGEAEHGKGKTEKKKIKEKGNGYSGDEEE